MTNFPIDEVFGAQVTVSQIKDWTAYIGFGVGAAAAIGSFFVGFWLLIVTLGGLGYGIYTILTHKSQKKQLEQTCAENIKAVSDILQKLFEEFKQYQKELDEYDSYYEKISNEFSKI